MSNEKISDSYVYTRTIYVAIPLYSSIPCVLPQVCRRNLWVRILLSPSYSFSFVLFSFSFPFFILFYFHFTLYQLPSRGLFVILSKYIHMRSCFEGIQFATFWYLAPHNWICYWVLLFLFISIYKSIDFGLCCALVWYCRIFLFFRF
jgi:hypothetical protein